MNQEAYEISGWNSVAAPSSWPSYATVFFNGVLVQNHFELKGETFYIEARDEGASLPTDRTHTS